MAQSLPYNPTRIFQNGSLVYVFKPSPDSPTQFQLLSADISSKVASSDLPYTTLDASLPFLDSQSPRAFTPVLDNGGNLTVYTGDCAQGATGAEVWSFTPAASEKSGKGTWQQEDVSFDMTKTGPDQAAAIGANFLNGGMAFSAIVNGDALETGAYFFGGMCPDSTSNLTLDQDSDIDQWQASAIYSNYMITLEPSASKESQENTISYQLDVSTSRGPPIAEAGFTLTGLSPSFSNRSDGTQTQQQNFVLVGGHTSAAFINMSQVALFSLPQQGWTFVPVQQPDTSRTDLAVRTDIESVDPRSGHTALLTPDGQQIIVFGGWVGDVNTPAEPQFAVLNIGDGYGGQGDWEWTIPNLSGSGLPENTGLYGHGATMLPGGVMMITGGYSITAPTNSRSRRDNANGNTKTLFLNVSSNTWTTDYAPPTDIVTAEPANTGPLSSPGQKAGLGVGLGIGFAAVVGLMLFYFWYTRRLKGQRDEREKQLHDLALGAHRFEIEGYSPGFDGRGGNSNAVDYFHDSNGGLFYSSGDQRGYGWRRVNGHDAERTGLLVEIPSPTRGLRRSLGGRPMTRYDDRRVRGSGNIHPIDELEEEQENDGDGVNDRTPLNANPEMAERSNNQGTSIFDNAPVLDPFTDSSRPSGDRGSIFHSAPTSPTREWLGEQTHGRQAPSDMQSTNGALFPGRGTPSPTGGRISPDKSSSERTGSNLSERSTRSNLSFNSSGGSVARTSSMRSTAILNNAAHANPFKTPDLSPTSDRARRNSGGWHSPVDPRTRSLTSIRSNGRPTTGTDNRNGDGDSFTTARSSFMHLQAEGEALLGGNPERQRPGTASTSNGSNDSQAHTYRDTEGSMSRAGTVTAATSISNGLSRVGTKDRSRGWLGSVRRALSRSSTSAERTRSLTTSAVITEPYSDDPLASVAPSDSEDKRNSMASGTPRRAASDASFWRNKRGRQDWLDEELDPSDPRAKWRRNSGDDWGAPEDIVLAEKERQRKEWRERGNLLVNLCDTDQLPTPRTPIRSDHLSVPAAEAAGGSGDRPCTPADEGDWDVEAAVERRVVQVMFTVPKSKLRVVNADVDRNSIMSNTRSSSMSHKNSKEGLDVMAQDNGNEEQNARSEMNEGSCESAPVMSPSPTTKARASRVKNLADKFEQMQSETAVKTSNRSPRASPSPSASIRSMKIRAKRSNASVRTGDGMGG